MTSSSSLSESTAALSQSLGHVLSIIDGLNAQANRLSSSTSQSHLIAILDGMVSQSQRLIHELDTITLVLESLTSNAKEITTYHYHGDDGSNNNISHACSILDGLLIQGKRLENAAAAISSLSLVALTTTTPSSSSEANDVIDRRRDNTDAQIVHLLSILDGLNVQALRLHDNTIFAVLDEINAKATRALL